jgi:hypothetical protein
MRVDTQELKRVNESEVMIETKNGKDETTNRSII